MAAYVRKKKRATPKRRRASKEKVEVSKPRSPKRVIRAKEPKGRTTKKAGAKKRGPLARKASGGKRGEGQLTKRSVAGAKGPKKRVVGRRTLVKRPKKGARVSRPTARKRTLAGRKPARKTTLAGREKLKKRAAATPKKRAAATPKKRAAAVPKKRARAKAPAKKRAKAKVLSGKLDKERGKLRTKKVRLDRKKVTRQRKKVSKLKEELKEVVAPKFVGRKTDKAEQLAHFQGVFKDLLDLALQKKQVFKTDYRRRRIDSVDRIGEQRTVRTSIMLDDAGVEEAMYQIEQAALKLPGRRYFWICTFTMAGMGERLIGYGNRVLQANHPDAHHFQIAVESSGVSSSKERMLVLSRETLEQYASEEYTLVMLLSFTVQNFTPKER